MTNQHDHPNTAAPTHPWDDGNVLPQTDSIAPGRRRSWRTSMQMFTQPQKAAACLFAASKRVETDFLAQKALFHHLLQQARKGHRPHLLFDRDWYLRKNPDVAQSGLDPFIHYLTHGCHEGRDPHPLFSASWYSKTSSSQDTCKFSPLVHFLTRGWRNKVSPHPLFDLVWYRRQLRRPSEKLRNPLIHYLSRGARQGLNPHPCFDAAWYTEHNQICLNGSDNPLVHYLSHPASNTLAPHPLFDPQWYLQNNRDVAKCGVHPLMHYLMHGWHEKRSPHPLFDLLWYLQKNPDVELAQAEPLSHFIQHGAAEGRSPHPLFDMPWYQKNYHQSMAGHSNPLVHYLTTGALQGFNPNPYFDALWYTRQHETLLQPNLNPLVHYVTLGAAEGRDPSPHFDTDWYLSKNHHFSQGETPLAHYIVRGRPNGHSTQPADKTCEVCAVLDIPFEIRRAPNNLQSQNVCLFVTYSPDGFVHEHVLNYLEALRQTGLKLIVIVTTEGLARPLPSAITAADGLIVRVNHGWDYAAWATAFAVFPDLWTANSVTLTNDSIYGPTSLAQFSALIDKSIGSDSDVVALTDSYQVQHHFSSYFFTLNRPALASAAIRNFWGQVQSIADKQQVINAYEITNLQYCNIHHITYEILFPTPNDVHPPINPTLGAWRNLLARGLPLIKVQALRDKVPQTDASGWEHIVASYNPELQRSIENHLATISSKKALSVPQTVPIPAPRRRFKRSLTLSNSHGATPSARPHESTDLVLEVPFRHPLDLEKLPPAVAVVVHIFYPELAPELIDFLNNIPVRADLFISTNTPEKKALLADIFSVYRNGVVTIEVFPNKGRDIAPALLGFRDVFYEYEYFLHLHSKKSPHDERFAGWRQFLLANLLGSPAVVRSIFSLLVKTNVGMVSSDHFAGVRNLLNWGYDFDAAKELLARLGIQLSKQSVLDFPSGSFFWGRTAALRPLIELGLDWEDFPVESGQTDGTLAHAIERSLFFVTEAAGYSWAKVGRPEGTPAARLVPVVSEEELIPSVTRVHRQLLENPLASIHKRKYLSEIPQVATRRAEHRGLRFNLVLPTLQPQKVFGGITTALRTFHEIAAGFSEPTQLRIIVTTDPVDLASTMALPQYRAITLGSVYDDFTNTIVDASQGDIGELPIRKQDVFLATAWWTAKAAFDFQKAQRTYHGQQMPVVYLIQDHEPDFYGWSERYGYATATYQHSENTIALINSEELANFVSQRYSFSQAFVMRYKANSTLRAHLKELERQRLILIYGRPSVGRNCFQTIMEGLTRWQQLDPTLSKEWRVVSAGESYDPEFAWGVQNFSVAGKLTLAQYAEVLSTASVGISLMLSPHPSYPPLEMAHAGIRTITNDYPCKNLALRSGLITSLPVVTPEALAHALIHEVRQAEKNIGKKVPTQEIRPIPCDLPEYDPKRLATQLEHMAAVQNDRTGGRAPTRQRMKGARGKKKQAPTAASKGPPAPSVNTI